MHNKMILLMVKAAYEIGSHSQTYSEDSSIVFFPSIGPTICQQFVFTGERRCQRNLQTREIS